VFFDRNGNGRRDLFDFGLSNFKVELLDDAGTVLATTFTGSDGSYRFNNINEPGTYTVRVTPRLGLVATTPNPTTVTATRGQTLRADFGFDLPGSWTLPYSIDTGALLEAFLSHKRP
jgi:hypothetical protein